MESVVTGMGRGLGFGTLAVTTTLLLGFAGSSNAALGWESIAYLPLFAIFLSIFAFFVLLLAALVAGLPAVWLLRRSDCASGSVGGVFGAVVGAAVFLLPAIDDPGQLDPELLIFAAAAMAGGGVTGWVWGEAQEREIERQPEGDHPHRIDDPRILR